MNILQEADKLIHGDRQEAYSHPLDDYTKTAALWSIVLGVPVTAEQALLCMAMVKVSRELYQHKDDNLIDAAGYIGCLQMAIEERARRGGAK